MKTSIYVFITMLIFSIPLNGQTQYTSVPRSGEGRFNRSSQAVFWANPIFFKPAVFFSSSEVNIRANRKWWRNNDQLILEPFVPHGYLPEHIQSKRLMSSDKSSTDVTYTPKQMEQLQQHTQLAYSKLEPKTYLMQVAHSLTYKPTLINYPDISSSLGLKLSENIDFVPNLYAQVALLRL